MEKVREKRKRQRRIIGCLAVFLMGSGLWLGIKGYGIAGDAAARGDGLQELQGVRWEKELFATVFEDYDAYLTKHMRRNGYMEDEEKERFGIYGYVWDYREGLALGYDLPSSTWYCFDEEGETVFTVKADFPAMNGPAEGNWVSFQDGLAALSLSYDTACIVDRTGRKVISEYPGSICMCRDQKILFAYSGGTGWSWWGIARIGEGKLKGV